MWQGQRRLAVVGLGRLGGCLARALHAAGAPLHALAASNVVGARSLASELGSAALAMELERVCEHADTVLIAVPDARIAEVCARLTPSSGHAIAHTSGALDASVLASVQMRGAAVGVFHPLQAFTLGAVPQQFAGIHIGLDADASFALELERIATQLGAVTFSLRGVDRAAYHAAAVFASNYLTALHAVAARVWQAAGLPAEHARRALAPLTLGAANAIAQHELPAALTGPLVRGDAATLERHLHALEGDPAARELYRALARELLRLPLALDHAARARLEQLLNG